MTLADSISRIPGSRHHKLCRRKSSRCNHHLVEGTPVPLIWMSSRSELQMMATNVDSLLVNSQVLSISSFSQGKPVMNKAVY